MKSMEEGLVQLLFEVCVCVSVSERDRERERDRQKEKERGFPYVSASLILT